MGERRKRQRLSEDGTAAITATADAEQAPSTTTPADKPTPKQDNSQRRSLFVRSLAPTVTTEDLTEHFSESYPIKHAVAVLDPATKQCKGFGFVTFADAEDAQRAMEELNGSELKGKKIKVEVAERRHREIDSDVPGQKKSAPTAAATKVKEDREQQRKEQEPPKLIIRNLPWSIKEPEDLSLLFRSYGKVKSVTLPKTPTGALKGFGFVLLRGKKNAEKALENLNGKMVDGRPLAVDWAVDKETWQTLQGKDKKEDEDEDTKMTDGEEPAEGSDEESVGGSDDDEEDRKSTRLNSSHWE